MAIRASVIAGRLVVDEHTDLPEGTVLDLVLDDEGDDFDDAEREALRQASIRSHRQALAGQTRDASEIVGTLRSRR